jgi:sulfatase modifying factor 1
MAWSWGGACLALAGMVSWLPAGAADRLPVGTILIDRTEVTAADFARHADATGLRTTAEREGGSYEYAGGWVRRTGWSFRRPFGEPFVGAEPAVHVTWEEARGHCGARGGRLPTFAEWRLAAYTETRSQPTDGFVRHQTYPYPVGITAAGMNTSGSDPWPRDAEVGVTRRGVNGLHDMGGNVWEWVADRRGNDALTAGGSWWYGAAQTRADAAQWKAADFHAVYVGFRCVYDPSR